MKITALLLVLAPALAFAQALEVAPKKDPAPVAKVQAPQSKTSMARKAELVTSSYVAMVMDGSGKHELWVIGSNDFDYDGNFMADVANGAAVNKTITLTGATHLEDMDDLQSVRPPVYQVSIQCLEWHGAKSTTVRTYHLSDTTLNCTIGDPIANSWRRGKHGTGTIAHEVTAVFRFKKVTIEEIPPPAPVK